MLSSRNASPTANSAPDVSRVGRSQPPGACRRRLKREEFNGLARWRMPYSTCNARAWLLAKYLSTTTAMVRISAALMCAKLWL